MPRVLDHPFVETTGLSHVDICVSEVEVGRHITKDFLVRLDNLLKLDFHEKVERINVLFDQSFDFEESGQEVPFVLLCISTNAARIVLLISTLAVFIGSTNDLPP